MKRFTQAKKYLTVAAVSAFAASPSFATEGSAAQQIFGAIDLTGIAALVTAAGVLIIGITMAFKSIVLGKRTVKSA